MTAIETSPYISHSECLFIPGYHITSDGACSKGDKHEAVTLSIIQLLSMRLDECRCWLHVEEGTCWYFIIRRQPKRWSLPACAWPCPFCVPVFSARIPIIETLPPTAFDYTRAHKQHLRDRTVDPRFEPPLWLVGKTILVLCLSRHHYLCNSSDRASPIMFHLLFDSVKQWSFSGIRRIVLPPHPTIQQYHFAAWIWVA